MVEWSPSMHSQHGGTLRKSTICSRICSEIKTSVQRVAVFSSWALFTQAPFGSAGALLTSFLCIFHAEISPAGPGDLKWAKPFYSTSYLTARYHWICPILTYNKLHYVGHYSWRRHSITREVACFHTMTRFTPSSHFTALLLSFWERSPYLHSSSLFCTLWLIANLRSYDTEVRPACLLLLGYWVRLCHF